MRRPPPPIEEERTTLRLTHKRTRRWCRGKQGVEHTYQEGDWITFDRGDYVIVYVLERCTACGRHGKLRSERRETSSG